MNRAGCKVALLAGTCTLAMLSSGPAFAQTEQDSSDNVIVVEGIRLTIETALNAKRDNISIVDGVVADDIEGLPNDNIAEVLQRIPGVQIVRVQGRGEQISIRGLPSRFARTTLNGQTLASASFDAFDFGFIESDIVEGIDVYKSQRADLDEGGLAGVVDIRTVKPLNKSERQITARAAGVYQQTLDRVTPRFGVGYVDQFFDGKFGVAANFVYEDAARQFDLMQIDTRFNLDTDHDGVVDTQRPRRPRLRVEEYRGDSYTASLGLQYQPTDQLNFELSSLYAREDGAFDLSSTRIDFGVASTLTDLAYDDPTIEGAGRSVVSQIATNVRASNIPVRRIDNSESYAVQFKGGYSTDVLDVSSALNYTKGQGYFENNPFFFDYRIDSAQLDTFSSGPYDIDQLALITSPSISDPTTFSADARGDRADRIISADVGQPTKSTSKEFSYQFDVDYKPEIDFISSIELGGKYRDVSFDREIASMSFPDAVASEFPDFTDVAISATDDFLQQHRPDGLPATVITVDLDRLIAIRDAMGPALIVPLLDQQFSADRQILAGYGMVNLEHDFDSVSFRGNLGVRYVDTEQTNHSNSRVNGVDTPLITKTSYGEWLPSLSTSFGFLDDSLLLRFAWSESLVRPELTETNFARTTTVTMDNLGVSTFNITDGNPDLRPATAKNIDVALEYYFGRGDAVYFTYFDKKVKSGVIQDSVCPTEFDGVALSADAGGDCIAANGDIYNILQVMNSDETQSFKGFEFGVNKAFDFLPGFLGKTGVVASYTHVKSDSGLVDPVSGNALPALLLSKDSYNVTGYYSDDNFELTLAYNYRSAYLISFGGFSGQVNQRAGRGQMDMQASYDVTDNFSVSFRGLNLLGKPDYDFSATPDRFQTIGYGGRIYYLTATFKM